MLGTFGPKGKHSGAFPGFSFCLVYLRLGDEVVGNPEMSMGTDKTASAKT